MELNISSRPVEKKRDSKRLRREGKIPAVLYIKGKPSEPITVERGEFEAALRQIKQGHLPTTTFSLKDASGKEIKAIVKDIQYHVTTYDILHLDFEELEAGTRVNVRVPITFTNIVDCQGIKAGGALRQNMYHVKINCAAEEIPNEYNVDVLNMQIGDMRKVSDLGLPESVRPLDKLGEVALMIAKR